MHVRVSVKRQANKTYRSVQIVQSFRRDGDGMPANRVIASLGNLPDCTIANLKMALAAARTGKRLLLPSEKTAGLPAKPVRANLCYLGIAVALSVWHHWRLSELLEDLLPPGQSDVPLADIIAALTVQRCVAPASKLGAARWLPKTALPELLGHSPQRFNNTRLHRALGALEKVTASLQKRLPRRYQMTAGHCVAMFLDVTDTWFVGHGPELAQRGKTKEGMIRRKVGIVLLCNEQGYPLRWDVLPGKRQDGQAMSEMIAALEQVDWVGVAPLVCDRAMGKSVYVDNLARSGLRFLTALPVDEYDSYTDRIPHQAFAKLPVRSDKDWGPAWNEDLERARKAARHSGLERLSDDCFLLDLHHIEKQKPQSGCAPRSSARSRVSPAEVLRLAQRMKAELDTGEAISLADLGRRHGMQKANVTERVQLLNLAPEIQQAVLDGQAETLSYTTLKQIRRLPTPQRQRNAFEVALHKAACRPPERRAGVAARGSAPAETQGKLPKRPKLRGAVYFNPEMFVGQRRRAEAKLAAIDDFARDLNQRLAHPSSRRDEASVHAEVGRRLHRDNLTDAFEVTLTTYQRDGRSRFHVAIELKAAAWRRRRRFDGFCFLVGHPELAHTAAEMVALYHQKDAVEKDFQTIKSAIKLRPVRHRTNLKVRAHVTLCMLALLVERTLECRLAQADLPMTASAAFEELASCHLNRLMLPDTAEPVHTVTDASPLQQQILEALNLMPLLDDKEVAAKITPR